MAGALLSSIPAALIYSFFVKYDVAGLTVGAVEGKGCAKALGQSLPVSKGQRIFVQR